MRLLFLLLFKVMEMQHPIQCLHIRQGYKVVLRLENNQLTLGRTGEGLGGQLKAALAGHVPGCSGSQHLYLQLGDWFTFSAFYYIKHILQTLLFFSPLVPSVLNIGRLAKISI